MGSLALLWLALAPYTLLPLVQAQLVFSLPGCVQTCIDQSQDDNCAVTDVACLCRVSAGNFLPDLVTCVHGNCDNYLDNNLLLTALSAACKLVGAPIPSAALRNAENQANSLATQATTTATVTVGRVPASTNTIPEPWTTATIYDILVSWVGPQTSTIYSSGSVSTVTVTTTNSGSTVYQVYPVTIFFTTTESGLTSTITSISTASVSNGFTELIPVVITGTKSDGSGYTSTTSEPGANSTYTTTDFEGSTITTTTTYTQQASSTIQDSPSSVQSTSAGRGGGSSSRSSTSERTTISTIFIPESTHASTSTRTSTAPSEDSTNSSPYLDTNNPGTRREVGCWMGLAVLSVVYVWV